MKKSNRRNTAFVVVATNHGSMLVNRHDYKLYEVGSSRVDLQACKLEYSIVSPK